MGDKIEELSALRTELDDIDSQIRSLKKARNALVEKITKVRSFTRIFENSSDIFYLD